MIRFILGVLLFFLIFRTIRNLINALASNKGTTTQNVRKPSQSKYKIDKEDVIDAHFEEIENSEKQKDKS